jgi:hypothetical protein
MKKNIFFGLVFSFAFFYCESQEKRALIIGIDQYSPPPGYNPSTTFGRKDFPNLDGCRNDALSMHSIVYSKFYFKIIDTLFDAVATRVNILKAMNDLLNESNPGDVAFIYYAGHGSQVNNSLSHEYDKKDETIVPSDVWKEGVEDIRDKELGKLFNKFVDKRVSLTVILDCCHSGSMSRGFRPQATKFRFIPDANYDSKDASQFIAPEDRKGNYFLILSATQDNEPAEEQRDDHNKPHGAFTIALTDALNQLSVTASAQTIFTSLRAILKSNGKNQEPVISGNSERRDQTLFGIGKGALTDKFQVAVYGIQKNSNKIFLQGGIALGLNKENELAKIEGNDTAVIVKIDSVLGINSSRASVIKGDISKLRAGELLEVTNWAYSKAPLLKIYIPAHHFSYEQVVKLAQIDHQLKQSKKIKWINDLERNDPYASIYFDQENCFISIGRTEKKLLKDNGSLNILQNAKKDSTLYFELPLTEKLANSIKERLQQNKNIFIVSDPANAHYTIYGTIDDKGLPSYGLRRMQTSSRDSLESMPVQTKNFVLSANDDASFEFIADSIYEYTLRLSKIRGWLHLSPPLGSKNAFPFHLEFYNTDQSKLINNHYKINDNISMHLVADSNYVHTAQKYVYVFAIDKDGNMQALYPEDDGNLENKFPRYNVQNNNSVDKDVVLRDWPVPTPSGTDNYFLLACEEAIPNSSQLFHQDGVRGVEASSPLEDLLNIGNDVSRGVPSSLPKTWALKKLSIKCTY